MTIQEMREKKLRVWEEAKALNEKRRSESREFSADEQGKWEKLNTEIDSLNAQITTEERAAARESEMAAVRNNPGVGRGNAGSGEQRGQQQEAREFRYTQPLSGRERVIPIGVAPRNDNRYLAAFRNYLRDGSMAEEFRATLQADSDLGGGFTVPTEELARLIQAVDNQVFMRQFATILPVAGGSVGAPALDTDQVDATWTTELATGDEDTSMEFGRRELTPKPLAKSIKISKKLLRASVLNVEALVRERLAYRLAVPQENAFLNGDGAGEPLGVFTANAAGISTGRDVSTGNSTTAIAADGLIEALYSLKAPYQANAIWGFSRTAVKNIRKLKDGNGQYLWAPGITGGQPDTILNRPFFMSEYVPATFTTGLYVGIVGDFSHYWIADSLAATIQVLVELSARTNQNEYIARVETDGMPVLEEAFARVKLA